MIRDVLTRLDSLCIIPPIDNEGGNEMSLADIDRGQRGIELTNEDESILWDLDCTEYDRYTMCVTDRNDYAVMLARTTLAKAGCRAIRDRVMPA